MRHSRSSVEQDLEPPSATTLVDGDRRRVARDDLGHREVPLCRRRHGRARPHERPPGADRAVAERRDIPVQFLEQFFSTLRRAGLLLASAASRAATRSPARRADHRPRGRPGARRQGRRGGRRGRRIWADGVDSLRTSSAGRRSPTSPAARPTRSAPACTTSRTGCLTKWGLA